MHVISKKKKLISRHEVNFKVLYYQQTIFYKAYKYLFWVQILNMEKGSFAKFGRL